MRGVSYVTLAVVLLAVTACDQKQQEELTPTATTGVRKAEAVVRTGPDHLTTEQRNVKTRLEKENEPGAIKHLYVISAYSGQVLIYSTIKGKVTSSGKRLSPTTVHPQSVGTSLDYMGFSVGIGGQEHYTAEVLQDDGTYGSSIPYLYWFDVNDKYHQHYVSGGQIIHVTEFPLNVKSVTLNVETSAKPDEDR